MIIFYLTGHMVHHPRMGGVIKRCVNQIPLLDLEASIQPITRTVLRVRLNIQPEFKWDDKVCTSLYHSQLPSTCLSSQLMTYWLFVYFRYTELQLSRSGSGWRIQTTITSTTRSTSFYTRNRYPLTPIHHRNWF